MNDAELDHWRTVTDPAADDAVAEFFAAREHAAPGALMADLVTHSRLPPEDRDPAIERFFAEQSALPAWADRDRMARGQAFFSAWALHQFTVLYLASLPTDYAAAKGVHVIWLTGRLQDDPVRRLNETAQFLMDISEPGGFGPGGRAVYRVLHVRLMHAAVRWLIDHTVGVARPAALDPAVPVDAPVWAASWGRPVNQEDLAGTLLSFTTVVGDALRRSGVDAPDEELADYLHLWRVVGHLLGIRDALLPADLAAAEELQALIFRRQHHPSWVGAELTRTLLGLLHDRVPRAVAALAPAMLRSYVGDDVADMIAVPRPSRAAVAVLRVLVAITRVTTRHRHPEAFPRWVSARIGRWMLDGLLLAGRKGERVPFAIPDHLAGLR